MVLQEQPARKALIFHMHPFLNNDIIKRYIDRKKNVLFYKVISC